MAGTGLSIHGENHGENEVPATRVELQQLQNSLLQAMERMFIDRLPAQGDGVPHRQDPIDPHGEARDENLVQSAAKRGHEDEFSNYGGDDWEVDGADRAPRGRGAAARGGQQGGHDRGRGMALWTPL